MACESHRALAGGAHNVAGGGFGDELAEKGGPPGPVPTDVLIESIRNDPIPADSVRRLRAVLQRELGGDAIAAPAYSALEAAGQMWWLCIYLWLLSTRSRKALDALLAAVTPIATSLRASTPERRPVYVALLDPAGVLLRARLVRTGIEPLPVHNQRPRLFPADPDPRFG